MCILTSYSQLFTARILSGNIHKLEKVSVHDVAREKKNIFQQSKTLIHDLGIKTTTTILSNISSEKNYHHGPHM